MRNRPTVTTASVYRARLEDRLAKLRAAVAALPRAGEVDLLLRDAPVLLEQRVTAAEEALDAFVAEIRDAIRTAVPEQLAAAEAVLQAQLADLQRRRAALAECTPRREGQRHRVNRDDAEHGAADRALDSAFRAVERLHEAVEAEERRTRGVRR